MELLKSLIDVGLTNAAVYLVFGSILLAIFYALAGIDKLVRFAIQEYKKLYTKRKTTT